MVIGSCAQRHGDTLPFFIHARDLPLVLRCGHYNFKACQRAPGFISSSSLIKHIFTQFSSVESRVAGSESATIQFAGSF